MPRQKRSRAEIAAAIAQHGTVTAAAKALGMHQGSVSRILQERPPTESVAEQGDERVVTKGVNRRIKTLKDLVEVCEIDLAEWEIERWVCNKWDMGYKDADAKAHAIPLFQVKAWLRRHSATVKTLQVLRAQLVADIRSSAHKARAIKPERRFVDGDWLFEFAPTDLHMGKYAWGEETVTDYDIDSAADLFNASLDFLLDRAMRVSGGKLSRILCLFGNDVMHMDSKRGETTGGTRMDVDTRYIKVYRRTCEIHRRAVNRLLAVAPVDIVIVPGNHDELSSFHLGEVLAATYDGRKHVTVDNSPRLRKYYNFGVNLFGFTHGDAEKVSELPLTMAREVPELWAKCSSREWHIGHLHKKEGWQTPGRVAQELFSDKGVRIRRLASLSSHDAWHTKHAYMDRRTCEGFVYHRVAGYTADLSFNVDHFTGKAVSK